MHVDIFLLTYLHCIERIQFFSIRVLKEIEPTTFCDTNAVELQKSFSLNVNLCFMFSNFVTLFCLFSIYLCAIFYCYVKKKSAKCLWLTVTYLSFIANFQIILGWYCILFQEYLIIFVLVNYNNLTIAGVDGTFLYFMRKCTSLHYKA